MTKHFISFFHATLALLTFGGTALFGTIPEAIHYQGQVTVDGSAFDGTGFFKFAIVGDATPATATGRLIRPISDPSWTIWTIITEPGSGYAHAPTVEINGDGSGATAVAVIEGGQVVKIVVGNHGSGYTTAPEVSIAPPSESIRTLWNNAQGVDLVNGVPEPNQSVALPVTQGTFSVALGNTDLTGMTVLGPDVFNDSPSFLRIWFSPDGSSFEQLTPDQPVLSVPYAMQAMNLADGAVTSTAIQDGVITSSKLNLSTLEVGRDNTISGDYAVALGGEGNQANGVNSAVLGGMNNSADGARSAIIGGALNETSGTNSVVLGGSSNKASEWYSATVGGRYNTASDNSAVTIGGQSNIASGKNAFASGYKAEATHDGSVVWADNTEPAFASTATNQFLIQTSGGVGINTNAPEGALHIHGTAIKTDGGSWSTPSDRRLKTNIEPLEDGVLERLLQLRGYTFDYNEGAIEKGLGSQGKQTGFIAQEVEEVFPDWIGHTKDDFLYVTERGATALLVEALRELNLKSNALAAKNLTLEAKSQSLNQKNRTLEAKVALLEQEVVALTDAASQTEELAERLAQIETLLNGEKLASN